MVLSFFVSIMLLLIALLHLIWGLRIWWPMKNEQSLVRAVAGFRDASQMPPPAACIFVALALLVATSFALELGGFEIIGSRAITVVGSIGLSAFFLGRGFLGFTKYWAQLTPEEPFRLWDSKYYSPLCIALGSSFAILTWLFIA